MMKVSVGSTPTAYRYTGQREDPGLGGLMFYRARYYDNTLGRFAQADTLIPGAGNPQAWDRYAYAQNNALKYNDPSGHTSACAGGAYGYAGAEDCAGYTPAPPITNPSITPPSSSCGFEECYNVYLTYVELVNKLGYVPTLQEIIAWTIGVEYWDVVDFQYETTTSYSIREVGREALARNLYERCPTGTCSGDSLYAFLSGYEPWFKHNQTPKERASTIFKKQVHGNAWNDARMIVNPKLGGEITWTEGMKENKPWQWFTFEYNPDTIHQATYGLEESNAAILSVDVSYEKQLENGDRVTVHQKIWFFTSYQSDKWDKYKK